ncbi:DUF397 domain-containing protein [Kitasatospora brasiliensis]|uniref:DUF397 domain-containing protein n=1 Tax=Kitasatospora brasiliensis TaxID=3058040 RepID=UPI002930CA64|nr:DUF397 domain-containing protein [Kitasatospora sp. K002]
MTRPTFTKSTYSAGDDNCVEVAAPDGPTAHIRDSKDPSGPTLTIPREAHTAFLRAVATGEFDFDLI